ncbi:MAG: ATP-binding cassette domain-containing protein [Patescibacteria group bacterium]
MIYKILQKLYGVNEKTIRFAAGFDIGIIKYSLIKLPLGTIQYVSSFGLPLLAKQQVDLVANFNSNQELFFQFALITLGLFVFDLFNSAFQIVENYSTKKLTEEINSRMEDRYRELIKKLDYGMFSSNLEDIYRELSYNIENLPTEMYKLHSLILSIPMNLLGFAAVSRFIDYRILISIVFFSLLKFVINCIKINHMQASVNNQFGIRSKMSGLYWKIWYEFSDLTITGKMPFVDEKYVEYRNDYLQQYLKSQFKNGFYGFGADSVGKFSTHINVLFAAYLVFVNNMTLGAYTSLSMYTSIAENSINEVSSILSELVDIKFQLRKLEFVLDLESNLNLEGKEPIEKIDSVEFEGVTYDYPKNEDVQKRLLDKIRAITEVDTIQNPFWRFIKRILNPVDSYTQYQIDELNSNLEEIEELSEDEKLVLNGLDFELRGPEFVSIIGNNGCGKSTMLRMISRGYDPLQGKLLVNGRPIQEFDPNKIREQIFISNQRLSLMRGFTLRNTLNFDSDPSITDANMIEVMIALGLQFTNEDLDKILGESLELSGGQEQLVHFSSVCLNKFRSKKVSLVILDEGMNQLDPIKKNLVINAIKNYLSDCIVILVSHEMSICMNSERVVVIEGGKVVAQGEPNELLKSENLFSQFMLAS